VSVARRLAVIGAALATTAVAGIWYANPQAPWLLSQVSVERPSALTGPYTPTYDFITPSTGWALVVDYSALTTRFFVFHTTDGAAHWYKQYVGKARGDRPYLHFFDANHGFAYAGFSYRTVDGGAHWRQIKVPGPQPYVTFASPTDGWAETFKAGSQHLYRTGDGGNTWILAGAAPPSSEELQPLAEVGQSSRFRESGEGWLGAIHQLAPTVFVTADGGATWQPVELFPTFGTDYYDTMVRLIPGRAVVAFVSDGMGHQLGALLSLKDGSSWAGLSFPFVDLSPDELTFVDADHWWLFHSGSVYTTDDGGRSWLYLHELAFPGSTWRSDHARGIDHQHAWWALTSTANSEVSALVMTSDGGEHWGMVTAPQP
jgi:photosystem II stability/assembly factor-like uncharacterized protein